MSFEGRDIISTAELSKEDFLEIMKVTEKMEELVKKDKVSDLLSDKVIAVLFMEPSTRTRLSFETAVNRLGAKPITVSSAASSSASKGESLADTAKTVDGYVDAIIVRQPLKGGAKIMADAADAPLINGGDGAGQHPSQALLDMYN